MAENDLAPQSDLIVFADGPKDDRDRAKVAEVRQYLGGIEGFQRLEVIERQENLGLAGSIINGVTEVVNTYGRLIVLEDDLVTSPYFLRYMNEALVYYENQDQVVSISGYIYPVAGLPETFFLLGADCWGWATWQRGWGIFEADGQKLLDELLQENLTERFDFNGAFAYTKMLREQIQGKNSSWAIRLYASAFLARRLTLYPGRSLVHHIGGDGSGTHCGSTSRLDVQLATRPVEVKEIPLEENTPAREKVKEFLATLKPALLERIICLLKRAWG